MVLSRVSDKNFRLIVKILRGSQKTGFQGHPVFKPPGSPKQAGVRCLICNRRGHKAKNCFQKPQRTGAMNVQDSECHEQVQAMVQNNQRSFGGQQASYRQPKKRQYSLRQDRRNTAISESNRQEQSSGQPEPNETHEVPCCRQHNRENCP